MVPSYATKTQTKKTKPHTIRSFCIDDDILIQLKEKSEQSNETVNAIVNKMLRDMIMVLEVRGYSHTINISDHFLNYLLSSLGEEKAVAYAQERGQQVFMEVIQISGKPPNFNTFCYNLREGYCRYSNWAAYSEVRTSDRIIINLNHKRGHIWSKCMKEYFNSMLKFIFGSRLISQIDFAVVATGLVISLPLSIVNLNLSK